MAKDKTKAALPATYEPEAEYSIEVAGAVPLGRLTLRPGMAIRVKGKVATGLGDAVTKATKVG